MVRHAAQPEPAPPVGILAKHRMSTNKKINGLIFHVFIHKATDGLPGPFRRCWGKTYSSQKHRCVLCYTFWVIQNSRLLHD